MHYYYINNTAISKLNLPAVSFSLIVLVDLECPLPLKALTETLNGEHTVLLNKSPTEVQFIIADTFSNNLSSPVRSEIDNS